MALTTLMMDVMSRCWVALMSCQFSLTCFVLSMRIMLTSIGFLCSNSHVESYPQWLSSPTQVQRALPSVEFVEEAMLLLDLWTNLNRPTSLPLVSSPTTSLPSGSTTPPSSPPTPYPSPVSNPALQPLRVPFYTPPHRRSSTSQAVRQSLLLYPFMRG